MTYNVYELHDDPNWKAPEAKPVKGKDHYPPKPPVIGKTHIGTVEASDLSHAFQLTRKKYPGKRLSIRRD